MKIVLYDDYIYYLQRFESSDKLKATEGWAQAVDALARAPPCGLQGLLPVEHKLKVSHHLHSGLSEDRQRCM